MKQEREFFESCPEHWRDGFLIPVRNRLSNMIEREYISKGLKNAFLKRFGKKVIYDDIFLDWYCSMKENDTQGLF